MSALSFGTLEEQAAHERRAVEYRSSIEQTTKYFAEQRDIHLFLLPSLADRRPDVGRFVSEPYRRTLAEQPFAAWRFVCFARRDTERALPEDLLLLRGYLDCLASLYGTNICVDTPVLPRIQPSSIRGGTPCFLAVRDLSVDDVKRCHRLLLTPILGRWSLLLGDLNVRRPISVEHTGDLPLIALWRDFFAVLRDSGLDAHIVDLDIQRNIVLITAPEGFPDTLERFFTWQ